MKARGEPLPAPIATQRFSGTFKVRIPSALHERLVIEARESAVSLNRLVSMKLASTESVVVDRSVGGHSPVRATNRRGKKKTA